MLSALDATSHTHRAWPVLGSPWCWACSAMTDWQIAWLDHLSAKE